MLSALTIVFLWRNLATERFYIVRIFLFVICLPQLTKFLNNPGLKFFIALKLNYISLVFWPPWHGKP